MEKTYVLKISAESKEEAITQIHDLATELLGPAFTKAVDVEEEEETLDDSDAEAKVLELAKLHKPLCPNFTGALLAYGYYDRGESQDYTVDLEKDEAKQTGYPDDGDYGNNHWTSIWCGDCNKELWPAPGEGVLQAPRVWDTTNTSA